MPVIHSFAITNFKTLFWVFTIACIILTGDLFIKNLRLTNHFASDGMESILTSKSFSLDSAIIESWKPLPADTDKSLCLTENPVSLLKTAKGYCISDVLLTVFICCLITIFGFYAGSHAKLKSVYRRLIKVGLFVFPLCILLSNILIYQFIASASHRAWIEPSQGMALLIKILQYARIGLYGILALLVPTAVLNTMEQLKKLENILYKAYLQSYWFRVIIIAIILLTIPFWFLAQGQDLLISSSSSAWGTGFLVSGILFFAFFNWLITKIFFELYATTSNKFQERIIGSEHQGNEQAAKRKERKVSTMLGVASIVCPATAILHAMQENNINFWFDFIPAIGILLITLSGYYILLKMNLPEKIIKASNKNPSVKSIIIIVVVVVPLLPFLLLLNKSGNSQTQSSVFFLYFFLLALSMEFFIITSFYPCISAPEKLPGKKLLVTVISLLATALFLLVNFKPPIFLGFSDSFLTLPLLMSGVIFYTGLFSLIIYKIPPKWEIPLVGVIVLLIIFLSSVSNSFHSVSKINIARKNTAEELGEYFKQWVLTRENEINRYPDKSYPVILINTYGGGIKAAAFTSMVTTYLESTLRDSVNRSFFHQVFSMSGSSGGTVGAAFDCAYRYQHVSDTSHGIYNLDSLVGFYQNDFLSPVLVSAMGRDFLGSMLKFKTWPDRSAIQEHVWEQYLLKYYHLNTYFPFDSIWEKKNNHSDYETPLLFSNTLNIDDGLKGICAPVKLSERDFPATIFVRDRIEKENLYEHNSDSQTISLMTGAFLSARFPFLSPSAKFYGGIHFMDAGGKDNSGAGTSDLIFQALSRYCEMAKQMPDSLTDVKRFLSLTKKLKFIFVSIRNVPLANPKAGNTGDGVLDLSNPVFGLINSGVDGNALAADATLRERYGRDTLDHFGFKTAYFFINPRMNCKFKKTGEPDNYAPVLPLGWQISSPALLRLKETFDPVPFDNSGDEGLKGLVSALILRR